jgi:hypothetical protein
VLQVQGWTVWKPVALFFTIVLSVAILIGVSMMVIESVRWSRRSMEHRATSASWVLETPPGLLDYSVDGPRAQSRFTKELDKLNHDTESLGNKLVRQQRWIERLARFGPRMRRWGANRSAKSIDRSASYIEKRLALFKALVKDIERNTKGFIGSAGTEAFDLDITTRFRDVIEEGVTTTADTLESVRGYRVAVEDMEGMNLSRTIRSASGRLAQALRGIETVFHEHQKAQARLLRELDRRLEEVSADREGQNAAGLSRASRHS